MKMQNVKFRSVDEFLDFLPADEKVVVEMLRKLIFSCVPDITEKLSFNVPFYKRNKGMFFIWPASVLWGSKRTYDGVRFGFQQGHLLTDDTSYLEKGTRKQVYWKTFLEKREVDVELLRTYIFDAVIIDSSTESRKR